MNDPLKQLESILDTHDRLTTGMVSVKDFEEIITVVLSVVKDLKTQLEKDMSDSHEMSMNECEKITYSLRDLELKMEKMLTEAKQSSMGDIKALASRLNDDIGRVRALIPTLPDLSYIDRKLSDIEAKIPKLPPPVILDDGEEIVNKINDLPIDDESLKIDAKHIKNLPRFNNGIIGGPRYIAGANITIEGNVISSTGGGSSFQRPLSGDLGQGVFTWTSSPNVLVIDGNQSLTATQTNGSVNWTVSGSGPYTTTFTAGIAPIDDIFAL